MHDGERHSAAASVLGHAMRPEGLAWGVPSKRSPWTWTCLRRAVSALGWMLCGLVGLGVYTNLLADDSALRARTEALARQHAGCGDACTVLGMESRRTVFEFRADYELERVGTIQVVCRRAAIVAGAHVCRTR